MNVISFQNFISEICKFGLVFTHVYFSFFPISQCRRNSSTKIIPGSSVSMNGSSMWSTTCQVSVSLYFIWYWQWILRLSWGRGGCHLPGYNFQFFFHWTNINMYMYDRVIYMVNLFILLWFDSYPAAPGVILLE